VRENRRNSVTSSSGRLAGKSRVRVICPFWELIERSVKSQIESRFGDEWKVGFIPWAVNTFVVSSGSWKVSSIPICFLAFAFECPILDERKHLSSKDAGFVT
jgi:hypothetical protein